MNVVYTHRARQDLFVLYDYIAYVLLSPEAARRTADRIAREVRSLSSLPERHPLYHDEPWRSRNVRFLTVRNYLIFYTTDPETVTVLRIMYAGRDVSKQLNDPENDCEND